MNETYGGGSNIFDQIGGLKSFLLANGWSVIKYGYSDKNVKNTFWSRIFKERLFEVILEKDGINISIVYRDKDGSLGKEDVYQISLNGYTSDWKPVDSFDKSKIKEFKRDSNIDKILNT